MRAFVTVYPRREILDPQGKAIGDALVRMGYEQVKEVRAGKTFEIEIEGTGADDEEGRRALRAEVDQMCTRLLANPIIEDYTFRLEENGAPDEDGASPGEAR